MKDALTIRPLALLLLLTMSFSSCGKKDVGEVIETNRVEDKSEYEIHIGSPGGIKTLIGENLEGGKWDPDTGLVWLSTDKANEPLGTLTLSIVEDSEKVDGYANVTGAILSTTDVRVGTGPQTNGKLYQQIERFAEGIDTDENFIKIKEIGANYIFVDEFFIYMEVINGNDPNAEHNFVGVSGWFIALK